MDLIRILIKCWIIEILNVVNLIFAQKTELVLKNTRMHM